MPPGGRLNSHRAIVALYCTVQFGKTLLWVAADLIAFYVLGVIEHISLGHISLVLMGGLAWHAASDVLVGRWLEARSHDRRKLALVAGVAVPIASGAFVLSLFASAAFPLMALALMMVSRTAYALFDVPHQTLIGRMTRRGFSAVKVVALCNLWGQIASLALGLGIAPVLGPATTEGTLAPILFGIAGVSALLSAPVTVLIYRLWDVPIATENNGLAVAPRSQLATLCVLALHFGETLLVTTASKLTLGAVAPGAALATMSVGRILASLPLPIRSSDRKLDVPLMASAVFLLVAVAFLQAWPGPISLVVFGLAGGWINILTWAWIGKATEDARIFGATTMLTKLALLGSIPLARVIGL